MGNLSYFYPILGWTVLMQSSHSGDRDMVDWLLAHGADPNQQMPGTGWTALHSAAASQHMDILKALLNKGGDKNLRAAHRNLGRNLAVENCTADKNILELLTKYPIVV